VTERLGLIRIQTRRRGAPRRDNLRISLPFPGCDTPEVLQPGETQPRCASAAYRRFLKPNGWFLLEWLGMIDLVRCWWSASRKSALSYALWPSMRLGRTTRRIRRFAIGQSYTSTQQDCNKARFSIRKCMDLPVAPSVRAAHSLLFSPPVSIGSCTVGFHVWTSRTSVGR
jgi:hypothetical protein